MTAPHQERRTVAADETLYEEADGIAIIAINPPEKKNTLTAGYDLTANRSDWETPYGAPDIEARDGAWYPVRDRDRPWGDYGERPKQDEG